jgi:hypothetical protein
MSSNETENSTNDDSIEAMYIKENIFFLYLILFFLFSEQKYFQSRPETYNGADRDLYSWTQTINDLDVRIKVKYLQKKPKYFSSFSSRFQNT